VPGFADQSASLGDVRRNRQRGSIQLVDKEPITSLESFGCGANRVGKVDGLLIDNQLLKHKTHAVSLGVLSRRRQAATTAKRVESRK